MANKEKIDYLLLDIRELEKQVAGIRDAEIYPVSFFSQAFELSRKILNDLHSLEAAQLDTLRKQMEAHEQLIQSIPLHHGDESCDSLVTPETNVIEENRIPPTEEPGPSPSLLLTPETPLLPEASASENEVRSNPEEEKPTEFHLPDSPVSAESVQSQELATSESSPGPMKTLLTEKTVVSLNDILEKQNLSDFRKAFSLNDRFRFRRELFAGDEERMNRAINDLNELHSYEESVSYLHNELNWNIEDIAVADFIKLLEKRFS